MTLYNILRRSEKSIEQVTEVGTRGIDITEMPIPEFGAYSIEGTDCTNYHIECVKPSPNLRRSKQHRFAHGEADYQQLLFEHFRCERKEIAIPEAVIPDTSVTTINYHIFGSLKHLASSQFIFR